jgi:hypothetical protein
MILRAEEVVAGLESRPPARCLVSPQNIYMPTSLRIAIYQDEELPVLVFLFFC